MKAASTVWEISFLYRCWFGKMPSIKNRGESVKAFRGVTKTSGSLPNNYNTSRRTVCMWRKNTFQRRKT